MINAGASRGGLVSMTTFEGTIEGLQLEHCSDRPLFNTKAVVQQTGIPAATLRAWERRYALFSPKRAENDYRLYTERDIVLLRWLRGRVEDGMSISQAIALYRHLNRGQAQHCEWDKTVVHAGQEEKQASEEYFDYSVSTRTGTRENTASTQVMVIVAQVPGHCSQDDLRNIADSLYAVIVEQCTKK